MEKVYTTGQIARALHVAPRTVCKWFDSGSLKGYRIPNSHDRRIPRSNLISFLQEHGLPINGFEDDSPNRGVKVLFLGVDVSIRASVAEAGFGIDSAADGYEAGIKLAGWRPDCVVIDCDNKIASLPSLRRHSSLIVGLYSGEKPERLDDAFKKPVDAALLAERIRTLVLRKRQKGA